MGYFNLDNGGIIRAVNLTGAGFLGVERSLLISRRLDPFISDETIPVFHDFLDKVFASDAKERCEVAFLKEGASPIFVLVEAVVSESREECRAVIIDITERTLAEVEKIKLEDQLQQAQKMESVGRLAGGVAHDFNNILTVIIGYANLALLDVDLSHSLHVHIEEILKAAERSANLTRQLLAFARKQIVVPKVLNLNETVDDMFKLLKRLIGEDIDLNWQPEKGLWSVKVDPSQIDQILANLCVNACDSIADVGKITIETGNSVIDEGYCADNAGFVTGEYVRLTVSDNGCGMDKETLAHIFEPFFTTKCVGEGTGLGLASVYGAAKQNNGFINVYSEPGVGTTFTIYLPRYMDKGAQVWTEGAEEPAKCGQETILLVEDEPAILNITMMLLTRQSYTVLAANSPGEAILLAGEHAGKISLLMTDVVMPKMNGRDLAKNLLCFNPHLKLLFMSGYTYDVIAHHGVLDEGMHFIQKPFTMIELAAKVRAVLDSK
ncbi:MAG TPA: ATP-binding protein [Desulfuromonadaceae bacterium]